MPDTTFEPPQPSDKRIAVRVTTGAERALRSGHPWVFDESITSASREGAPGDLAVVFDRHRRFVAIGLWDPASPIRLRVLHTGSPLPIDSEFWVDRVVTALARRDRLFADPETTGIRLVNGENDGFPGLVVDLYDRIAVSKIYSAVWLPYLSLIASALSDALDIAAVVVRTSRRLAAEDLHGLRDGDSILGRRPGEPVEFLENGLLFRADVVHGQKTGHFLDQRDNRAMVRGIAAGAAVLDVFSGTGGFSVNAAAGGARSVTSVDISRHSLDAAQANMRLNHAVAGSCRHRVARADAFAFLDSAAARGEQFDLVIIDPPSFAQRQSKVAAALAAYGRLTRLGIEVLGEGGTLVQASCSSRVSRDDFVAVVQGAAAESGVILDDVIITGHPLDHPVSFPEGAYLKALYGTKTSLGG